MTIEFLHPTPTGQAQTSPGAPNSRRTEFSAPTGSSLYRRSGFVPVEPELFELILPMAD
jgi:hypothetical protein